MELPKTFDSKSAEERWFQLWIDLGYFKADPARPGKVFSVVIPPPNVTGQLHLGHALNVSLQDIIVRTRRMQGYNTLWLPGTDHAGIATQNAVEKDLAKEGKDRHQLGRDAFVDRVWQWRETYGGRILNQLRRLGASCDWSRERFTLDAGLSQAVTKVFVDLYNKKLIYRAMRLINWCPRCETALSDLEVDHTDVKGSLWYIRYPLADGSGSITIATTRPETMLGDTAVAVNPDDERYKSYVGKTLRLPLIGREIPIIADAAIDREFGTGALKVTPAHDPVDFDLGKRHGLAQISIFDGTAHMNENAGPYRGMSREGARKEIVKHLEIAGLLEKIEPHQHAVGTCSRCDSVVEPMLSEQWFLAMRAMADRAIEAVRKGDTTFHPKRWENVFFNWLENIHDWCISRQLWWGHRIPAYRCVRCDHLIVAAQRPSRCPECDGSDIVQDDDVLDTWFSSGLWPMSTLGWPEETADFARYYPTSLLLTGFDIIFFWVARMMMFGLEFTDKVPFKDVYITPLVRDAQGKKMSKTKGNVVDPLDLMEQVRRRRGPLHARAVGRAGPRRNPVARPIRRVAQFRQQNLERRPLRDDESRRRAATSAENRNRKAGIGRAMDPVAPRRHHPRSHSSIDAYEFNVAAMKLYQFIWHEFCDWYIELSKEPLKAGGEPQAGARWVLINVFDKMLRLLHPFMPFVSEEIWQVIRPYIDEPNLAAHLPIAKYPEPSATNPLSPAEELAMNHCIEATEAINSLRSLLGWHPGQRVTATIKAEDAKELETWRPYATTLAKLEALNVDASGDRAVFAHLAWADVGVDAPDGYDFEVACQKLQKQLDEVGKHVAQHEARLERRTLHDQSRPRNASEVAQRFEGLQAQRKLLSEQLRQLEDRA